jgi:hypothetical protein
MSFSVRYGDRIIDLHQATDSDRTLIAELHEARPWRDNRDVFQCLETGGDTAMHICRKGRTYYFAHFSGGAHGSHEVIPESDAHKRMKDYTARSAETAGLTAIQEYRVPRGRLDLAITGGKISVDIESQIQEGRGSYFKSRTTTYRNAGFEATWFSDRGSVPSFLREVPAFGCNPQPWNECLPKPRSATATGLTVVEAVRCVVGAFPRCPDGNRRPCGKRHPKRSPWLGLTVDDVIVMRSAGEIVPLASRDGCTYLVSPADLALYRDLTGGLGEWNPGRKRPVASAKRTGPAPSCTAPRHNVQIRELCIATGCPEPGIPPPAGWPALAGWFCAQHAPERLR